MTYKNVLLYIIYCPGVHADTFILGKLKLLNIMYLNIKRNYVCRLLILLNYQGFFFLHWAVNRKKGYVKTPTIFILGMPIPFIKIYLYITHKVVKFLLYYNRPRWHSGYVIS